MPWNGSRRRASIGRPSYGTDQSRDNAVRCYLFMVFTALAGASAGSLTVVATLDLPSDQ